MEAENLTLIPMSESDRYEASIELLQERIAELEFAQEDFGWERLGGEKGYEFSRDFLRRLIARSRLFYLANPLIRRACTLQADYIFAQGVNVQATTDIVNQVIQEFVDDTNNRKEFTGHNARLEMERTLLIDGNLFLVLFTDKIETGKVQVRSISVDEITEIISNPEDSSEIWFYKREWTPTDDDGNPLATRTAYYPDIDYMPINGRTLRLPKTRKKAPIYWDAPIIQAKTGALKKSKFGAPETYPALNWAKAHEKMLSDWATIISTFAKFAFQLTVPGNKQSIAAARNKLQTTVGTGTNIGETNPPPNVASIFTRQKDGATLEAIKTSGATTSAKDARELRIQVAAAMGLPDPMLSGEVDVGNLATAKTLDRPTELKFRSRQEFWEEIHEKIFNWVIEWSIKSNKGILSKFVKVRLNDRGIEEYVPGIDPKSGKEINLHIEVVFPPILEKTIQERIDAVTSVVTLNGKDFALNSPELMKMYMRLSLQALGLNDVDELVDLVFKGLSDEELKNPNPEKQPEQEPKPTSVGGMK